MLRDPKLRSIYDFGGEKAVAEQRQRREKVEQQLEMSRRATAVELPALSVLMHRIGRGVEWEEILAAIRFNDAQLPRVSDQKKSKSINQSNICAFIFRVSIPLVQSFMLTQFCFD